MSKKSIFEIFADEIEEEKNDNDTDAEVKEDEPIPDKKEIVKGTDTGAKEDKPILGTVFLSPDMLEPYRNQPFNPYPPDKLRELSEDIKRHGILEPVIVRPLDGRYQIIAGHNRTEAAKLAGLAEIPCTVKDYNDDTAALVMIGSNLNQREGLLPSEKARAYKIKSDLQKKQDKSTSKKPAKISDGEIENSENSHGGNLDNKTTVYRYLRLNYLTDELLQLVDDGEIILVVAETISFLKRNEQEAVHKYFFCDKRGKLDTNTAQRLRQQAKETKLTYADIEKLMQKSPKAQIAKFTANDFKDYLPADMPKKQYVETIREALKQYYSSLDGAKE